MDKKLAALYFFGRPFSPLYGSLMKIREQCYQRHFFTQSKLPVPVISIGNLMMGGTGKTPLVRLLARHLRSLGFNPAVISRGYGGTANKPCNVISNGKQCLLLPEEAGDEPYMLATSLTDTPVITGHKRAIPARYAIEELAADCLILDDGFQHLALHRDINIVLFDSTILAGNSRIFPGGPLREPVSALHRANCFVMTGTTPANSERAERFAKLLQQRFPGTSLFFTYRSALKISSLQGILQEVKEPSIAFCGIANPERFRATLEKSGIKPQKFLAFDDHHKYNAKTIVDINQQIKICKAQTLITTEKDAAKLHNTPFDLPLTVASFEVAQYTDFTEFIDKKIQQQR